MGAFASALAELIDDGDKRRRLGAAAKTRAAGYSLAAVGPKWETLLAQVRDVRKQPHSGAIQRQPLTMDR